MTLSGYLLGITAIVIISSVCQVILPDGRMKKTTKIIFGLILITVIVKPVFSGLELDYDKYDELLPDRSAVMKILDIQSDEKVVEIKKLLNKKGIPYENVFVETKIQESELILKKVIIKLNKLRIKDESEHINITRKTFEILEKSLSIPKEVIVIE